MSRPIVCLTLTLAALFSAGPANAGWYAKSTHSGGPGGGATKESEMYYENHMLRIDNPDQTSLIINLGSGQFTFIDHGKKLHASATLMEMVKMRDEAMAGIKAQVANMPPEQKAMIEKQLAEQEKAMKEPVKVTKLGKSDTVSGVKCEMYSFKAPDGEGEACLTEKPGADVSAFRKDSIALAKKLSESGAGKSGTSLAMLELADSGFPMRTKRTMSMGAQKIENVMEVKEMKNQKVAGDKFTPPTGYEKKTFQELMAAGAPARGPGPGPGGPPGPGPGPH